MMTTQIEALTGESRRTLKARLSALVQTGKQRPCRGVLCPCCGLRFDGLVGSKRLADAGV